MSNLIDAIAEKAAEKSGWYYINEFRKRLKDQGYEIVDRQNLENMKIAAKKADGDCN